MLGKLTWAAIPFDQPIPMIASGVVALSILAVLAWVVLAGHLPYLWREWITSVDHKRIGVHVYAARARNAAARLYRRDHDALAAGNRLQRAWLSAAGTLQSDFCRPRHADDLLRGDAVRHRPDELRRATSARRTRCCLPDAELDQLLAYRDRGAAGQCLARGRRVRADRLGALPPAIRTDLSAWRRR